MDRVKNVERSSNHYRRHRCSSLGRKEAEGSGVREIGCQRARAEYWGSQEDSNMHSRGHWVDSGRRTGSGFPNWQGARVKNGNPGLVMIIALRHVHSLQRSRFLDRGQHYFSSRIHGVKVIPTNNPSGPMKRLTVWPHGSSLFLTSIR